MGSIVLTSNGVLLALWTPQNALQSPEALRILLRSGFASSTPCPVPHRQPRFILHSTLARIVVRGGGHHQAPRSRVEKALTHARSSLSSITPSSPLTTSLSHLVYC